MYRITWQSHRPDGTATVREGSEMHTLETALAFVDQVARNWPTAPNPPTQAVRPGGGRLAAQFDGGRVLVVQVARWGR